MTFDRRQLMGLGAGLSAGLGVTLAAGAATDSAEAAGRTPRRRKRADAGAWGIDASDFGLRPDRGRDVSKEFQRAIDGAARSRHPLLLPPGTYKVHDISLRSHSQLVGVPGATIFEFTGGRAFLQAIKADQVRLEGITLDGAHMPLDGARADGLLSAYDSTHLVLRDCDVKHATLNGISLRKSSGAVSDCRIENIGQCGLFSLDAMGLTISQNDIADCGNNGVQVWRSSKGDDGTIVSGNRIARIASRAGGTGQNGNGVNVFRAASVQVSNNRITDCAYSAVRGNAASNIQITGNSAQRIGEVALYAEFGFLGALIANNLVDGAATGIAATNFNDGGRLALIQGNILRNLKRREFEPADKRGNGITAEADAVVSGNIIETAETAGIIVGWGKYLRDVSVTANLIRNAPLGIGISGDRNAGACLVAQNMISGHSVGAIRAMDHASPLGDELIAQSGPVAGKVGFFGLRKTSGMKLTLAGNVAS